VPEKNQEKQMNTQKCNSCNKTKSLAQFYINKTKQNGHSGKCIQCTLAYSRHRYQQRKKEFILSAKTRRQKLLNANLCVCCGKINQMIDSQHCEKCREKKEVVRKKRHALLKKQAFEHYGGAACACCGESEMWFLTIDHINNNGAAHRKQIKGLYFYRWLQKANYPKGYQVLCWNCNLGRYFNKGICPHKERNLKNEVSRL